MDDDRLEQIERRMEELDQRESAMEKAMDMAMARSRAAMGSIVPTRRASTCARRGAHNLLAVRSMLDHWAEQLDDGTDDDADDGGPARDDTGRENIPID